MKKTHLIRLLLGVLALPLVATANPYAKPGFVVSEDEGRLWVFREGAKEIAEFEKHGELVKMVVLPGAGPDRKTLKGPDRDTLMAYALTKPGFVVSIDDGRLWVFREGAKELEEFQKHGELVKMVVRPGAGPNKMTVKAADGETIDAYMAAQ
jgi:sugar lactone lactonase YvrE